MRTTRVLFAIILATLTALFAFTAFTTTDMTAAVTSLVLTVLLAAGAYFVWPREPKPNVTPTVQPPPS